MSPLLSILCYFMISYLIWNKTHLFQLFEGNAITKSLTIDWICITPLPAERKLALNHAALCLIISLIRSLRYDWCSGVLPLLGLKQAEEDLLTNLYEKLKGGRKRSKWVVFTTYDMCQMLKRHCKYKLIALYSVFIHKKSAIATRWNKRNPYLFWRVLLRCRKIFWSVCYHSFKKKISFLIEVATTRQQRDSKSRLKFKGTLSDLRIIF